MKKRIALVFLLSLMAHIVFANDTYFYLAGGSLTPVQESDVAVEMKEETIVINLQKSYYEVTVDFTFYNPGKTVELDVGFPFFSSGIQGKGEIWDYKCWTNEVEVEFAKISMAKEWRNQTGLEYANVRSIRFPQKQNTRTRVQYKSKYGVSAPSFAVANYLYGTGLSWSGKIGKIRLVIENNDVSSIFWNVRMADKSIKDSLQKTGDNRFEAVFENVESENYEAVFEIMLEDVLNDNGPRVFPAYFPFNREVVSQSEFKWYTKAQLRLVRNAIYALHGYSFKSKDLKDYFNSVGKYWNPPYKINPEFSEDELSEIEKTNVRNLLEEEKRGSDE